MENTKTNKNKGNRKGNGRGKDKGPEGTAGEGKDWTEDEVFNKLPGGRRASLIQRTPPKKDEEDRRRGSLAETPYMTAASPSESEVSEGVQAQMGGRELRVGLQRMEMVRPPTPLPPAEQNLVVTPEDGGGLMPPPLKRVDTAPTISEISTVRTAGGSDSSDVISLISDGEMGDAESLVGAVSPSKSKNKRKRGRPETTGGYRLLKQRRKEEAAMALAEKERREEAQITDDSVPIRYGKNLPSIEDVMEEMTHLPTPDITAETIRHIEGVARVAQVSSNLKGTAKRTLSLAALKARAAIATLAVRDQRGRLEEESHKEIETLRRQVRSLKADNTRLAAEGESARLSIVEMEREMGNLRASLREIKDGMGEMHPSPVSRRGSEGHRGTPENRWPAPGGRDGSQSAPVLPMSTGGHDPGVFLLQQMEETFERLLSQKLQFLEPVRDQLLGMQTPVGVDGGGRDGEMSTVVVPSPIPAPRLSLPPPLSLRKRGIGRGKWGEGRRGIEEDWRIEGVMCPLLRKGKMVRGPFRGPPLHLRKGEMVRGPLWGLPLHLGMGRMVRRPLWGLPLHPREERGKGQGFPLTPPSHSLPPPENPGLTWARVVGRREKKGVGNPRGRKEIAVGSGVTPAVIQGGNKGGGRRRPPVTAAITIAVKDGRYGEIIKTARRSIGEDALREMGIQELAPRP